MKHWVVFLASVMALVTLAMSQQGGSQSPLHGMVMIPAGSFEMGDHHGFVDPQHPSDEVPLHTVRLDSFQIGVNDVTTREYAEFLNSALAQGMIEVRNGAVYLAGSSELLCDTRQSSPSSRIGWDGKKFSVLDRKEDHPMVCVRWHGAVVYCNWLSAKGRPSALLQHQDLGLRFQQERLPPADRSRVGIRGTRRSAEPYCNFPGATTPTHKSQLFRNRESISLRSAAVDDAGRVLQWETAAQGRLRLAWRGRDLQTSNGANGFGLYDMAGNVWQWCTEWYERNYYSYSPQRIRPGRPREVRCRTESPTAACAAAVGSTASSGIVAYRIAIHRISAVPIR